MYEVLIARPGTECPWLSDEVLPFLRVRPSRSPWILHTRIDVCRAYSHCIFTFSEAMDGGPICTLTFSKPPGGRLVH